LLVCAESSEDQELAGCEAVAQYDFEGRTKRELSFKKGDMITLFQRMSVDWWEGSVGGKTGLIPDKYLKIMTSSSRPPR